jgi:hypothetical protein
MASLCKWRIPYVNGYASWSAGRKQILPSAHRACLFSRLFRLYAYARMMARYCGRRKRASSFCACPGNQAGVYNCAYASTRPITHRSHPQRHSRLHPSPRARRPSLEAARRLLARLQALSLGERQAAERVLGRSGCWGEGLRH